MLVGLIGIIFISNRNQSELIEPVSTLIGIFLKILNSRLSCAQQWRHFGFKQGKNEEKDAMLLVILLLLFGLSWLTMKVATFYQADELVMRVVFQSAHSPILFFHYSL